MNTPFPACLVSGGQTGADRAALDFAIARGITHAGFCPLGRKSEDGPIPFDYNLTETATDEYPDRTRRNVHLGDATVIFTRVPLDALLRKRRSGSALTAREAARAGRPFIVLHCFPDIAADAGELLAFLKRHSPRVLNVAGSRESVQPGVSVHVAGVLAAVAAQMPAAAHADAYPLFSRGHVAVTGRRHAGKTAVPL
jgi:hypothetical protein